MNTPQDRQPPQPDSTSRRRFRWLLVAGLTLAALPLLLLLSIYWGLRSPLLQSHIWPRLQPLLQQQTGFEFELDTIQLDLLRHLKITGLQIHQQHPDCQPFNMTLARLELHFSLLTLLRHELRIEQLLLQQMDAQGCLVLPESSSIASDRTTSEGPAVAQTLPPELLELLQTQPLSIILEQVQLDHLQLDVQVQDPSSGLQLDWAGQLNLNAALNWQADHLQGHINTRLDSLRTLKLQQPGLQLSLTPQLTLQAQLDTRIPRQITPGSVWPLNIKLDLSSHMDSPASLKWQDEQQQLQLLLTPDLQLQSHGSLNLLQPDLTTLHTSTQLQVELQDLQWQQDQQHLLLPRGFLQLHGQLNPQQEQAELDLQLRLQQLQATELKNPLDLQLNSQLTTDLQLQNTNLQLAVQLADQPLLQLDGQLVQQPFQLQATQALQVWLPQQLSHWTDTLEPLAQLGDVQLQLQAAQQVSHNREYLLSAMAEPLEGRISSQQNLQLTVTPATQKPLLRLTGPLLMDLALDTPFPALQPELQLSVQQAGLQLPELREPLPLLIKLKTGLNASLTQLNSELQVQLGEALPLLDLTLQLDNQPQQARLQMEGLLHASSELSRWHEAADPLLMLGSFQLAPRLELQLQHQANDLQSVDFKDHETLHAQLTFEGQLIHQPTTEAPLQLLQPMTFSQQLRWQPQGIELLADYQLDELLLPGLLHARNLHLKPELKLRPGLQPNQAMADLQVNATALQLSLPEQPSMELATTLLPLQLNLQAELADEGKTLTLHQLQLQLADWLQHQLQGKLQTDVQQAYLTGLLQLTADNQLLADQRLKASGGLRLPWQLSLAEGRLLSVNALAIFEQLSLALDDYHLTGLQGQIRLDQELEIRPDQQLAFRYLLIPDPFQRVDYNRMEPFLDGQQSFRVESLGMGSIQVGPLQATLPIRQNLLQLQQFSLRLFGGDLAGQFYLDTTPGAWRLGLLSRVSQVDLRRINPDLNLAGRRAPVSLRTAVEFDLSRRLLEGRIDITDINRTQLLQLLDLIDPDHLDPQLANVRAALRLTHPIWIRADMQQGLMNLSVALSLFSEPLQVRGLPLSPIIERFGEALLLLPDQLPLE